MFILLNYSSSIKKANVNNLNNNKVTNTKNVDNTTVKNFNASLADILYGKALSGNYNIETIYMGAKFNFNCTDYRENKCNSGSALLTIGNTLLPLYTYDNEDDNYYNYASDYYIIVNDNNIILTENHVGNRAGTIKIYDKNGNKLSEIKKVITGYKSNDELINQLYPNIKNDKLYYYICDNNQVYSNSVSINNTSVVETNKKVNGVKCF